MKNNCGPKRGIWSLVALMPQFVGWGIVAEGGWIKIQVAKLRLEVGMKSWTSP